MAPGTGTEPSRRELGEPAPQPAGLGLTEAQAAAALAALGPMPGAASSRSYRSIVRANVLTVFNLILAVFGAVTLAFGDPRDALFLTVIVANSTIGIAQEVRAKRALDRLALLVAPRATVIREGKAREVPVGEVAPGDLVRVAAGDQIVADGRIHEAHELRLDESLLTGESEPVARGPGEDINSGVFAVEGAGSYVVSAVGADSLAARLVGEARSFRHPRSPLEQAVNRLLYGLVGLMILLGPLLGYSLYHRHVSVHTAVATSVAGVVSLIPEGLVVLVSLTFAVASVRMARRGVLAQQLNAIESLASVDVLCMDKTGTLTEAALRVAELVPAPGIGQQELSEILGRVAASVSSPNATVLAIANSFPAQPEQPLGEVAFSSRRRWSGVRLGEESYVLGAPERLVLGGLAEQAHELQLAGRRVLAIAASAEPLPSAPDARPPQDCRALGLVVLAERLRPHVAQTIAFLREQGVELKVLSGDATQTAAAIARDVGIPVGAVSDGARIPENPAQLRDFALETSVVGRISPEGKRAVVGALQESGRYVAMLGDGVNDVPALKAARLAIAQGSGTQMARGVSDLVLVSGDFDSIPALVHQGRQALRNLSRVTKLYVTKSAFAAFLILTIGTSSEAYPLLPRHLTLAAALTIGIPTFFLALASSTGPWRPERFVRGVARFAIPAGVIVGTGTVTGYLFSLHDLDYTVMQARTVATAVVVLVGLYLVLALEAPSSRKRLTLLSGMCLALGGLFVAAFLLAPVRSFFALSVPTPGMVASAVLASALAIGALALAGFTPISAADSGASASGERSGDIEAGDDADRQRRLS